VRCGLAFELAVACADPLVKLPPPDAPPEVMRPLERVGQGTELVKEPDAVYRLALVVGVVRRLPLVFFGVEARRRVGGAGASSSSTSLLKPLT
jgi:hypothetical protein